MKPGEFDDLVRQKFDQADFEYNPGNWEKLTEELDGQKKRRGGLLFWWMPVVGVAASVAMAFGVSTVLHKGALIGDTSARQQVAAAIKHKPHSMAIAPARVAIISAQDDNTTQLSEEHASSASAATVTDKLVNATSNKTPNTAHNTEGTSGAVTISGTFKSGAAAELEQATKENLAKKKKKTEVNNGYFTFREPEQVKKEPKVAIILSGGVNYSNNSNGYMVGATARRMINDKVYIESDVAFIGTNNSRKVEYIDYSSSSNNSGTAGAMMAGYAAKGTATAGKNTDLSGKGTTTDPVGVLKTATQSYSLYYAQVTPSIGYKLAKRVSVGVGPDFQQMLVDNRPEINTAERGNIKVAPVFDMGFMGKTEVAVTKNIKAAVYYREGINNVITPTNKYIDRNYLQFQIKCAILNR